MTTYNPEQAEDGVLYPCHGLVVQFYIEANNRISLQMYQRSADTFLGLPFNIASYAALLYIIVELVNNNNARTHINDYVAGRIIIVLGDTHIYSDSTVDHVQCVKEQLKRFKETYRFPKFKLRKKLCNLKDIENLKTEDMEIIDYSCNSIIKAKMAP